MMKTKVLFVYLCVLLTSFGMSAAHAQGNTTITGSAKSDSWNNVQTTANPVANANPVSAVITDDHSVINYEKPERNIPALNPLGGVGVAPTLFTVDQTPNVAGVSLATYARTVCPVEGADRNTLVNQLRPISIDDKGYNNDINDDGSADIDKDNIIVKFYPRRSFSAKGNNDANVATTDGAFLQGKKVVCLGAVFSQARVDGSDLSSLADGDLVHAAELFVANTAGGHRNVRIIQIPNAIGAARQVDSSGLSGSFSPAIQGFAGMLLGTAGNVTGFNGNASPASQLGFTALVIEEFDARSKHGYFIATPAQYDMHNQAVQQQLSQKVTEKQAVATGQTK